MTTTAEKTRSVEEIKRELEQARQAFNELKREQAAIPQRLKDEAAADQDALTEAALSGSLKGAKTPKLDKARAHAAELPYLLWAAEIKVLELTEEHSQAKRAELDAQRQELRPAVEEAEAAYKEAQENLNQARNEHHIALEQRRDLGRGEQSRQFRLSQLRDEGPAVGHA
jgi:chromosome segregation ATPase